MIIPIAIITRAIATLFGLCLPKRKPISKTRVQNKPTCFYCNNVLKQNAQFCHVCGKRNIMDKKKDEI